MDLTFTKPRTEVHPDEQNFNHGSFVITPLERGFGITIGNSIRRVLLSSLPGTAICSVQIEGVQHEFQNLDNVVEDIITIILNLKRVVLKTDSEDPNFETTLEITAGEGEVTAGNIFTNTDVQVVNPEQHICTVAAGGSITMFLKVNRGVGFVSAAENKQKLTTKYGDTLVGEIAIDSLYTPVTNVSYEVEKTLENNDPSHEKLTIDVTTNGSITPSEAIAIASKMMIEHLQVVCELNEKSKNNYMVEQLSQEKNDIYDTQIVDLDLTIRSFNCLHRANILTVGDLVKQTEEELMKVRNLGRKSVKEIKEKLEELGVSLRKN